MARNLLLKMLPDLAIDLLSKDMTAESIIVDDVAGFTPDPPGLDRFSVFIVYEAFKNGFL